MRREIYRDLGPVRRRQLTQAALRWAALGLLVGSVLGIGLGLARWWTGGEVANPAIGALLVAGPIVGLIVGSARRRGWHDAAVAVDAHYNLKDRTATALAFLDRPEPTPWHELQVRDAAEHLASVQANAVVPIRLPRTLPFAVGALGVAAALLLIPLGSGPIKANASTRLPGVLAASELARENLKPLDELVRNETDPKLQELLKQLKKKVEEMKKAGVDEREALAKLSEMQTAIQAQQAQYNVGLVDGQLKSLGSALAVAEALEAAGQAMQEAQFDKAAEELEKLDDPELERKEAKALEEKLKQVAQEAGEAGLGQIGEAANAIADGVKGGGKSRIKQATNKLAQITKAHSRRRRIRRLLDALAEDLNESKSQCKNNSMTRGKRPERSKSPSTSFGMGTSGNAPGAKTNLLAKRNEVEVQGDDSGEGPSEMETTHSPEGRQRAARSYREAYRKAKERSEAVLDSEPIPLGHRQTIRKYFELIRPQNDDPAGAQP